MIRDDYFSFNPHPVSMFPQHTKRTPPNARENLLRKNFEARLREVSGEGGEGVPMAAEEGTAHRRPRTTKSKVSSSSPSTSSSVREPQRAAVRSSASGAAPSGVAASVTPTAQR